MCLEGELAASFHSLLLERAFKLYPSHSVGLGKAVISFRLCGRVLCVNHLVSCLLLMDPRWRGMVGELSIPAHNYLASGSTLTLQVSSLPYASQPCSSPSIPPVLSLVWSFEEITSGCDYLLYVLSSLLHFRYDRMI